MRNPLISILNYLELLNENELDPPATPGALEKDLLAATNSAMENALPTCSQWSRSQMEGPAVKLAELNLLSAIKSTLDMGKNGGRKERTSQLAITSALK